MSPSKKLLNSLVFGATILGTCAQTLDAEMVNAMGNNSLFTRWRPTSHFIAPAGWMNDPCGTMYDPNTDTYHVLYQWHPFHVNWGNISWGHATSKDLVTWTDVGGWEGDNAKALGTGPDGSYNHLGIFSGTAQPVNLQGEQDGTLLSFYTSVSKLPTGWSIPYQPGTETQSIAISNDGGVTWSDYENNPIISSPPEGWNITGWRDPFVEPWPEMDALLGNSDPHYYAVFGSGIKGVGPRIPFYSAPATDLTNWTFLGALWEPQPNTTLGSLLETGTYGFNFEVSGFFSLPDSDGNVHYFAQMGTEGGNVSFHQNNHWSLWNEGIMSRRENGSAEFTPVSGGVSDWGNLYAMTSFMDTKTNRRIQWGWAPEDMGSFALLQQGFQGALALPRELFVHETKSVVLPAGAPKGTFRYVQAEDGTFTAYTLGARVLDDVACALRNGSQVWHGPAGKQEASAMLGDAGSHMELMATFRNMQGRVGLSVAASPGMEEYTTIYWEPSNSTWNVDRSMSSMIDEFLNDTVVGYFAPHNISGKGVEDVNVHLWIDGSILELHVNDRFSLTTRIYPAREDSTNFGVYVADGASVDVSGMRVWSGLMNVWPERPLNSSSQLIYDTVEQTNNYTWWPGY